MTAQTLQKDDMVMMGFNAKAPKGYVLYCSEESTQSAIFVKIGSVAQQENMSLIKFSELMKQCPV